MKQGARQMLQLVKFGDSETVDSGVSCCDQQISAA
jgi:hypothetical protein